MQAPGNPTDPTPSPSHRQHPLMIAAAIAVILFCAVGTAAILGWLPSSRGTDRAPANLAADPNANATLPGRPMAVATVPAPASVPTSGPAARPASAYAPNDGPAGTAGTAGSPSANAIGYGGTQGATGAGAGYAAPEPVRSATGPGRTARANEVENGPRWCASCGNVESIHETTTRARGSGVGAGAGAILGGLLGNQIGSGNGRSLATVAGAVGGAVVGNQVEGNMHPERNYEIRVRLDDGTLRTFHQHSAPRWRTGDRVRIVKGTLRNA